MHRELNPNLFGTKAIGERSGVSQTSESSHPHPSGPSQISAGMPRVPGPIPPEVKLLEAHVHALKLQLQASEKRSEMMHAQMQELLRATTSRFERVSHAINRVESSTTSQIQELNTKYAGLASKMNERRVQDAKVQEMIDRHNHIVRNFENRLVHLQRVLSEQEMQLLNASAALEDARHEISRLKRP